MATLSNLLRYHLLVFKIHKGVDGDWKTSNQILIERPIGFETWFYQLENSASWKETWRISLRWVREKEHRSSGEIVYGDFL